MRSLSRPPKNVAAIPDDDGRSAFLRARPRQFGIGMRRVERLVGDHTTAEG